MRHHWKEIKIKSLKSKRSKWRLYDIKLRFQPRQDRTRIFRVWSNSNGHWAEKYYLWFRNHSLFHLQTNECLHFFVFLFTREYKAFSFYNFSIIYPNCISRWPMHSRRDYLWWHIIKSLSIVSLQYSEERTEYKKDMFVLCRNSMNASYTHRHGLGTSMALQ